MRKYTWKHTKTANGFDSKIILHNYILYQQECMFLSNFSDFRI